MTTARRDHLRAKVVARTELRDCGYKVDGEPSCCRIWLGPDSGKTGRGAGYPRMNVDGATMAVHIVFWVVENGPIPPRKQLDHLCRQRLCVEEAHLELVTNKRNAIRRDKANGVVRKARKRNGKATSRAGKRHAGAGPDKPGRVCAGADVLRPADG